MQVICAQCRTECVVPEEQVPAPGEAAPCQKCGADLSSLIAEGAAAAQALTRWLVLTPGGQVGPLDATEMSQLLGQGRMDWTTLVWRQGLKGWRPARRDPQLVTAAAAARGGSSSGDTQRVAPRRHLMPAADTIVQAAPPGLTLESGEEEIYSWPEPDNSLTQVSPRIPSEPTLAAAFRSAPSIIASHGAADLTGGAPAVGQRRSSPTSWLPSAQSMLIVAVVAFAAGVLVAALWGRLSPSTHARSSTVIVSPPVREPQRPPVAPTEPHVAPPAPAPLNVAVSSMATTPSHAGPLDEELRREVKRVSPDIRRCVNNLAQGADLDITFEGSTGRVRDVKLRGVRPAPGRVECITQAARQMQVEPFTQPEYRFLHKFSYGF